MVKVHRAWGEGHRSGFTFLYLATKLAELTPLVILVIWWGGITNLYQGLACDGRRFLVGLVSITILYHARDLGLLRVWCAFTNHGLRHRDTQHTR